MHELLSACNIKQYMAGHGNLADHVLHLHVLSVCGLRIVSVSHIDFLHIHCLPSLPLCNPAKDVVQTPASFQSVFRKHSHMCLDPRVMNDTGYQSWQAWLS